jgi:hypothetical protein
MIRAVLIAAAALLAAPAIAQTSASLPVTCSPATGICVTATPVTNPDGTLIGAGGGGSATRTTAAGTSDTQAVPVQGVTNGVPQRITGVGQTTTTTAQTVVPASDSPVFPTTARGVSSLATTQVSVGTTATIVAAARTARARLVVTQSAAGPCYFGPTTGVTATTGARLTAVGASKVYTYAGALYGICPGGAVTVDVDEEY